MRHRRGGEGRRRRRRRGHGEGEGRIVVHHMVHHRRGRGGFFPQLLSALRIIKPVTLASKVGSALGYSLPQGPIGDIIRNVGKTAMKAGFGEGEGYRKGYSRGYRRGRGAGEGSGRRRRRRRHHVMVM